MTTHDSANHMDKEDRLRVLLALGAQEPREKGPCPSDEDMAAFIDGKLSSRQREEIFRHLNQCPDCYHDWLEVAAMTAQDAPENLLIRIKNTLTSWADLLKIPEPARIPGFATAFVCLILVVWWTAKAPEPDKMLDHSYQNAVSRNISPADAQLPWENSDHSFAFGPSDNYSLPVRAFGAGLWEGRQELTEKSDRKALPDFLSPEQSQKDWPDSEWAVYYHIGRWSSLLQGVCRNEAAEMPENFWKDQKNIIAALEKSIRNRPENEREAGFVKKGLGRIHGVLKKAPEIPGNRIRHDMAYETTLLVQQMIP
ncbi:MAG: zf-HC2 domain-containing protein [Desulfococcaceae bacterium]|jgi:hypothetical protein|nr:zf-HC2 domain-containing protein [Desulfococcaceae bacterium]